MGGLAEERRAVGAFELAGVEAFEEGAEGGAGAEAEGQQVAARDGAGREDRLGGEVGQAPPRQVVEVELGVGAQAVEAVELELEGDGGAAEHLADAGLAHLRELGELHVVADGGDDGLEGGAALLETAEDGRGHLRAEGGVVGRAIGGRTVGLAADLERAGLADVVQQDGPDERGVARRGRGQRQHLAHVRPDVALGVPHGVLRAAAQGRELGEEGLQKAALGQQIQGSVGARGLAEGAQELGADALGADAGEGVGLGLQRGPGGRLNGPPADGGEADGAEQAQAILAEAAHGVAHGADDAGAEVAQAADEVDDAPLKRVVEEGVDGEVAALGVVLGGVVGDALGVAAVLVAAVGAEGGDVVGDGVLEDEHDAEALADAHALRGEEGRDLLGRGGGGDVDVLDGRAAQGIAHAPAGEVGGEAVAAEAADDGLGAGRQRAVGALEGKRGHVSGGRGWGGRGRGRRRRCARGGPRRGFRRSRAGGRRGRGGPRRRGGRRGRGRLGRGRR